MSDVLYENYDITGYDGYGSGVEGRTWESQTFTPLASHSITSIEVRAYRANTPGIIKFGIRAVDISNSADLCTGSLDGDTITADTSGDWYEITFPTSPTLSVGSEYAIVVNQDVSASLCIFWMKFNSTTGTYANGWRSTSLNDGVNWMDVTLGDLLFREYGIAETFIPSVWIT